MAIFLATLALLSVAGAETITGYIYCDNYFEFYFNGELIKKDPIDFTPHNAVKVSFEYSGTGPKTYAILCQDFASESGYEYTETSRPQLGDGAFLAEFSDGTRTSSAWKTYVVLHGPVGDSCRKKTSRENLGSCKVQDNGTPKDWYSSTFDDSTWSAAVEYDAEEAGWGKRPRYSNGQCGGATSPLTKKPIDPKPVASEDECLNPRNVLCGGDEDCSDEGDGTFIWGEDADRDNRILFRYTVPAVASHTGSEATAAANAPILP